MKSLIAGFVVITALSGCLFSWSVRGKYSDVVGGEFVTTKALTLWKMQRLQYTFEPYHLSNWPLDRYGSRVQLIPAGARIHVVDARFKSNIDAGFDYLIADLYLSPDARPVRFEQMADDTSDSEYFRRIWRQVK